MKPKINRPPPPGPTEVYYKKYIDYITNAGGNPTVEWFDEDWAPIGPEVRRDMETAGLALVIEGRIYCK